MDVRDASLDDLPAILALYRQLTLEPAGYQSIEPGLAAEVFGRMASLPGHHLLVADLPDMPCAGSLQLMVIPSLTRGRPFGIIESVVVDDGARRRGAGTALLEAAVARARQAGCYKVELQSRHQRSWAHPFYEAVGFSNAAAGFKRFLDD